MIEILFFLKPEQLIGALQFGERRLPGVTGLIIYIDDH
jgi:hypothetical protein